MTCVNPKEDLLLGFFCFTFGWIWDNCVITCLSPFYCTLCWMSTQEEMGQDLVCAKWCDKWPVSGQTTAAAAVSVVAASVPFVAKAATAVQNQRSGRMGRRCRVLH